MNSQNTLTRELALRIGLAARALPDTDAKRLLTLLTAAIGSPLTDAKLASLDLPTLKTVLIGLDDSDLSRVLYILKQTTEKIDVNDPVLQAYVEGDMPNSVRIACASSDAVLVDGHFGTCPQFYIYQVSATAVRLIAVRNAVLPEGLDVEDKNVYRAELLQDCNVLYIASVGGPAAAKIVRLGIHPMKQSSVQPIARLIKQLQQVIAGTPPPWLAKAMGVNVVHRFHFDHTDDVDNELERDLEATG